MGFNMLFIMYVYIYIYYIEEFHSVEIYSVEVKFVCSPKSINIQLIFHFCKRTQF